MLRADASNCSIWGKAVLIISLQQDDAAAARPRHLRRQKCCCAFETSRADVGARMCLYVCTCMCMCVCGVCERVCVSCVCVIAQFPVRVEKHL